MSYRAHVEDFPHLTGEKGLMEQFDLQMVHFEMVWIVEEYRRFVKGVIHK